MSEDFDYDGPVHEAFGLTYAAYYVMPRRVLQSMPVAWQKAFVALNRELSHRIADADRTTYHVALRGADGRFQRDELADYRHAKPLEVSKREPDDCYIDFSSLRYEAAPPAPLPDGVVEVMRAHEWTILSNGEEVDDDPTSDTSLMWSAELRNSTLKAGRRYAWTIGAGGGRFVEDEAGDYVALIDWPRDKP